MKGSALKKFALIAASVCFLMQASFSLTSCTDYKKLVDFTVDVEKGRNIRVLQLSDPQLMDKENAEERCYKYIRQVVDRYDPDLIIVTGDLVYGRFDPDGSIFENYITFMESLKTPWAPVFGNHDNESEMGVDWQCQQLEKAKYCLFEQRKLTGNGNYSVGIMQGGKLQRAFFMLDSNGCSSPSLESYKNEHLRTSGGIFEDQIEWYKKEIKEITKKSPDTEISFAFHIQPNGFRFAVYKYEEDMVDKKINLDTHEAAKAAGDFGYVGANMKGDWDQRDEVWKEMCQLGDSIFVGHEHLNSCSVVYKGVRMQYGQKSSTYDRYNKLIDGQIVGDYSHDGEPILGGTKITIDYKTGKIGGDSGLILYDPNY